MVCIMFPSLSHPSGSILRGCSLCLFLVWLYILQGVVAENHWLPLFWTSFPGDIMFELKRRPPDYQPRNKRRKNLNQERMPYFLELHLGEFIKSLNLKKKHICYIVTYFQWSYLLPAPQVCIHLVYIIGRRYDKVCFNIIWMFSVLCMFWKETLKDQLLIWRKKIKIWHHVKSESVILALWNRYQFFTWKWSVQNVSIPQESFIKVDFILSKSTA